jgi:GT2 family glycosyltransferase
MMPRAALEQVGLFDPRFFLYYEEVDHCRAMRRAGWSVHYFADTTVVHIGGESARSDHEITALGRQVSALQIESELLYFRKHYGVPGVWASLVLTALADAWLGLKSMLRRPRVGGPAAHSKHTATMFSLVRRTAWATRPTH